MTLQILQQDKFDVILNVRVLQVLRIAEDSDKRMLDGENLGPLCALPLIVKDNVDVAKYFTAAGTPALEGEHKIIQVLRFFITH